MEQLPDADIAGANIHPCRREPVEGWTVKPLMVRQAHHERLNLKLFRLKWVTQGFEFYLSEETIRYAE